MQVKQCSDRLSFEFTEEEEEAKEGMMTEMSSMNGFDVFDEIPLENNRQCG